MLATRHVLLLVPRVRLPLLMVLLIVRILTLIVILAVTATNPLSRIYYP